MTQSAVVDSSGVSLTTKDIAAGQPDVVAESIRFYSAFNALTGGNLSAASSGTTPSAADWAALERAAALIGAMDS
jgi:hypothetical protein